MQFAFCAPGICSGKHDVPREIHPIEIRVIAGRHRGSAEIRDVTLVPLHHDPRSPGPPNPRPIAQKRCKPSGYQGNEEPRKYPSCLHTLIERPSLRSVQPRLCSSTSFVRHSDTWSGIYSEVIPIVLSHFPTNAGHSVIGNCVRRSPKPCPPSAYKCSSTGTLAFLSARE